MLFLKLHLHHLIIKNNKYYIFRSKIIKFLQFELFLMPEFDCTPLLVYPLLLLVCLFFFLSSSLNILFCCFISSSSSSSSKSKNPSPKFPIFYLVYFWDGFLFYLEFLLTVLVVRVGSFLTLFVVFVTAFSLLGIYFDLKLISARYFGSIATFFKAFIFSRTLLAIFLIGSCLCTPSWCITTLVRGLIKNCCLSKSKIILLFPCSSKKFISCKAFRIFLHFSLGSWSFFSKCLIK